MKTQIYKNVNLLMADEDVNILNQILADPAHSKISNSLVSIIETDNQGRITFFLPSENTKWSFIFYIQNLMIRQRLYQIDQFLERHGNGK